MKELDEKELEIRIVPKYIIARFMRSKKAFKIRHFQPITCFFGILKKDKQLHIHLRFDGKDEWSTEEDTLDIDIYIPKGEHEKIRKLLSSYSLPEIRGGEVRNPTRLIRSPEKPLLSELDRPRNGSAPDVETEVVAGET